MLTLLTIVLRNAALKNKEKLPRDIYRVLSLSHTQTKFVGGQQRHQNLLLPSKSMCTASKRSMPENAALIFRQVSVHGTFY